MPKLGITNSIVRNHPRRRTLSGGGGPIPTAGLSLWLKADAGVTLSGSNATAWADQSGNGNNFTGTAGFLANTLNGKPVINFNGINTALTSPAGLLSGFSALSFIAVWNVGSDQSNVGIFGTSNYKNLEVIVDGDVNVRIRNNNHSDTFIDSGLTNVDEFTLSYFDASNLTGSAFINGAEVTVPFVSQIVLTDAGAGFSNGTYTRETGGTTTFTGPNANEISWNGYSWNLFDEYLGENTYAKYEFDLSSTWYDSGGYGDPPNQVLTTTNEPIANQSAVQMPLASNITYELGRYAYPEYQTLYASFQLAEFIIYNSKLTTPQRQQVEAYLNSKYAIY